MQCMLVVILVAVLSAVAQAAAEDGRTSEAETAVLLHGLARTDRSMRALEQRLSEAGFRAHNLRYASTTEGPEALVREIASQVQQCCATAPRLHFVTHSLGGILIRGYLAGTELPNLGRVVMLSPPNHGSELVDVLGDWKLFQWLLGPTARQLGTDEESFLNRLPPPNYEVGVIAGNKSINPLGSCVIPGENDGTVSVSSAKLPGMADFFLVPHSHAFIMRSDQVAEQVIEFLRRGRFRREGR